MTSALEYIRAELGTAMAGLPPGLPSANELCTACVNLLGVDGAAISMVDAGVSRGTFGASGEVSRRLDEYQFTFGEGPCLDASGSERAVFAPDLNVPEEQRWPVFTRAVLDDGIQAVFALPIRLTSSCIGALDLFRQLPGPLSDDHVAGGMLAAELAALPLLDLLDSMTRDAAAVEHQARNGDPWSQLAELDRVEVHQATGMLIAQLQVSAAEALVRLRGHAFATGQTASEAAWAVLERRLRLERDNPGADRRGIQS